MYIYGILVISKVSEDHLEKLETTINTLKENGLKCNMEIISLVKPKM